MYVSMSVCVCVVYALIRVFVWLSVHPCFYVCRNLMSVSGIFLYHFLYYIFKTVPLSPFLLVHFFFLNSGYQVRLYGSKPQQCACVWPQDCDQMIDHFCGENTPYGTKMFLSNSSLNYKLCLLSKGEN